MLVFPKDRTGKVGETVKSKLDRSIQQRKKKASQMKHVVTYMRVCDFLSECLEIFCKYDKKFF